MKQTSNVGRWWLIGMTAVAALVLIGTARADITFSSATSTIHMNPTNTKVRIGKASNVTGWGQRSIVKAFGNNASTAWSEAYGNGSVVGGVGQSGVTAPARTNLVDANSNAIGVLLAGNVSGLVRATSNLLLYTARTNSSSIFVLRSRADSATVALRTMSNAMLALGTTIRTTSNAINLVYQNLAVPTTDSIDGTVFARYHTAHHVFHNNGNAWTIRGWVRFNDGFTVMPLGSVLMDTLTTVSGGFDLRDTGTLILNNDLYLAHNVTLTNGGNIKGRSSSIGQANTIFMGGDLTLSEATYARTLHITGDWSNSGTSGDLIIDGCGHTLNIGDRAQIFVDQNITLTLRNMTIKTGPKSLNNPAIQLASHGSKLALDNVMFDLGADFHFINGQIFIHDEVAVTGTSAFVYQSPRTSYITSGATWSFEQGTTFSVAPSTFTDCPYTVNNTYTNNAFIVLADASSALSLNSCSFQTTFTGLRLRSGMVLFDNKVAIDTTAGVDLATTGTTPIGFFVEALTGSGPIAVSWSPDSRFLAVSYTGNIQVFRFNGSNAPVSLGPVAVGSSRSVVWSPDGRFLASANSAGNAIQVFRFSGSSAPVPLGTAATGSSPYAVTWSPDGRFLAAASEASNTIQVFRFDGSSAPVSLGTAPTGSSPRSIAWAPNGRFLATSNYSAQTVQVYSFNGNSAPVALGSATTGVDSVSVAWSPDGRFLSVANSGGSNIRVYRFSGGNAPVLVGTAPTGTAPFSAAWSPDGRFLAVPKYSDRALQVYKFNGSGNPALLGTVSTGPNPFTAAWSPDGRFVAVVTQSGNRVQIFSCNYYYTGQPSATQGFSNGLLFGDKRLGSNFDANVQVLSGAVVKVKGKIKDDSV